MTNRKLTRNEVVKARKLCRQRDGDRCNNPACAIPGDRYRHDKRRDLDLDHIDCKPKNNPADGSNWQLLCHRCNCRKSPRGKQRNPRFNGINKLHESKLNRTIRKNFDGSKDLNKIYDGSIPPTMRKNLAAEPAFREAVVRRIDKVGREERSELIDAACETADCSQSSGSNYLGKMCSANGRFICELDGKDWYVRRRRPDEMEEEE